MTSDAAELSSLLALLDDLARRVTQMAERRSRGGQDPDEVGARLFEVERALREAQRRLDRAISVAG